MQQVISLRRKKTESGNQWHQSFAIKKMYVPLLMVFLIFLLTWENQKCIWNLHGMILLS